MRGVGCLEQAATSAQSSAASRCGLPSPQAGWIKENFLATHFLEVDADANVVEGEGRPSAETLLHIAVARLRGAGAVLHTHSVWSNILSDAHVSEGGVTIEGYEMLKGLEGVSTHEHSEWLPVIENSQDMRSLAVSVEAMLGEHTNAHGFLLRRHGLYTWGSNLAEAKRHVEIFEFLLEVLGRTSLKAEG